MAAEHTNLAPFGKATQVFEETKPSPERDQGVGTVDFPPVKAPSAPPVIPNFELIKLIGGGSFGQVWLARNRHVGQFQAVKVFPKSAALELNGIRECLKRAGNHPHLIPVHDVGETDDWFYCVMPLADDAKGEANLRSPEDYEALTLERRLKRQGPLGVEEALLIADQILTALEHLQTQGAIHGDVKPANILRHNGAWKLADLGLITAMEEGRPGGGTPGYLPPDKKPDDQYALGKTLFRMVTGAALKQFPDFAAGGIRFQSCHESALRAIILKACASDPAQRFRNAAEMRQALLCAFAPLREMRSPPRLAIAVAIAAVAVVALVLAIIFWPRGDTGADNRDPRIVTEKDIINLRLWEPDNPQRRDLRLHHAGALPVKSGDKFFLEIRLKRPAYPYVVWIDPEGKAAPIYPWAPGNWSKRISHEVAVARLDLPPDDPDDPDRDKGRPAWSFNEGPGGMETLILMLRDTPLPRNTDLEKLFTDFPKQLSQHRQALVWFENGEVLQGDPDRGVNFDVTRIDDPVLVTQRLLKSQLQPLFSSTLAVSFANQGKK